MEYLAKLNSDSTTELTNLVSHLRLARKRRRMSLADMAKRIDVSPSTLCRLEAGDPTVALGTMLQALSVLGLLNGLSEFIAPENDVHQTLVEARNIRMGKGSRAKKVFNDEDLNF